MSSPTISATHRDLVKLVDARALMRLTRYVSLLGQWRKVTNLISDAGFDEIWDRHVLDAVYLQYQQPEALTWLDFGSGAGLPSVVIASIIADLPAAQIHCVEIDRRKCAFLREVASKVAIPIKIHNIRAEEAFSSIGTNIDVITARAFSSLDTILRLAGPFLSRGARAMLPRGRSAYEEVARLDSALYSWTIAPNRSAGGGVFLDVMLRDTSAS